MIGQEVLDIVLSRCAASGEYGSGAPFDTALNTAVQVIFNRLWERKSDMAVSGLSVVSASGSFALPSSFRGLAEQPYLVPVTGSNIPLTLLPRDAESALTTGAPVYYRLSGSIIDVFPATTTSYTLQARAFTAPPVLTTASTLPWDGLLDNLIIEAVMAETLKGGATSIVANEAFQFTMDKMLDVTLAGRNVRPIVCKMQRF
jgi:hypothetical protein